MTRTKTKRFYNHSTRVTATVFGVLLGLAGMINHGLFEILQGNESTNGYYIEAIGHDHRFWEHGTEGAFTLIHNYLITGICVILVSLAIVVWSIKYLHLKHGATVFLLLMILLTLVGGGLGHIVFFVPTWAYATRIDKSLLWWKKKIPETSRKVMLAMWKPMLVITAISWLMVMELGIFGFVPNQHDPEIILNITFAFVLLTAILANFTFIFGFAKDIEERSM